MIRADKDVIAMIGPDFVIGAELMGIIGAIVKGHEKTGVNICKATFKCAKDIGEIDTLIKFAELMKSATEKN